MNVNLRILDVFVRRFHIELFRVIKLTVSRLYPKFFFEKRYFEQRKIFFKIHVVSEKLINSFEIKYVRLSDYLLNNYFV